MSFYKDNVKTHLIDPVYHGGINPRTEFRFEENKVYMLNVRLANLGCVGSNAVDKYPAFSGVLALIKHMYVTDGKAQIDVIRDVHLNAMVLNYKTSNSNAYDKELRTLGNFLGFDASEKKTVAENPLYLEDASTKVTDDINTTARFYLSLSRALGFFSQIPLANPVIPAFSTQYYKNLRIVIEWNTQNALMGGNVASILEPLLIADELIGPIADQFKNSYKGCKFDAYEFERVNFNGIVPDQASTKVLEQYYRLDGFKGKYLKTLTWQILQDGSRPQVRESYSVALYKEQLRLGINKNWGFLPWENGVANYNIKLGVASQSLGTLNLAQGMQYPLTVFQRGDMFDQNSNGYNLQGLGSLGSLMVDMPISSLEAYHSRTGVYNQAGNADFPLNAPASVYYLGRVAKTVLPTGDGSTYDVFEDLSPYTL